MNPHEPNYVQRGHHRLHLSVTIILGLIIVFLLWNIRGLRTQLSSTVKTAEVLGARTDALATSTQQQIQALAATPTPSPLVTATPTPAATAAAIIATPTPRVVTQTNTVTNNTTTIKEVPSEATFTINTAGLLSGGGLIPANGQTTLSAILPADVVRGSVVRTITGSANQVQVSTSGEQTQLTLPQEISTESNVRFASVAGDVLSAGQLKLNAGNNNLLLGGGAGSNVKTLAPVAGGFLVADSSNTPTFRPVTGDVTINPNTGAATLNTPRVRQVTAGTGLVGGSITDTGTLAIDTTSVPLLSTNNQFNGTQTFVDAQVNGQLLSGGTEPTAFESFALMDGTCDIEADSTDVSGILTITTGTMDTLANPALCVVNFASAFEGRAPNVLLMPASKDAADYGAQIFIPSRQELDDPLTQQEFTVRSRQVVPQGKTLRFMYFVMR
jgi:hypothetical protein